MRTDRRRRPPGVSLVEMLMVSAVFTVLVLATFGIIRYCTKNIGPIEDRSSVLGSLRKVQLSVSEELRRSTWKTVLVGNTAVGDPYMRFLCFKSFMSLSTPNFFSITSGGSPEWTKYVLFYVFRPKTDGGTPTCGCKTPAANPDNVCPHKVVLRVDIMLNLNLNEHDANAARQSLRPYLQEMPESTYDLKGSYFSKVNAWPGNGPFYANRILSCWYVSKSILSFNPEKIESATIKEVRLDVRCFKIKEGSPTCQVGVEDLTKTPFVIQSESRIIVQNQ